MYPLVQHTWSLMQVPKTHTVQHFQQEREPYPVKKKPKSNLLSFASQVLYNGAYA